MVFRRSVFFPFPLLLPSFTVFVSPTYTMIHGIIQHFSASVKQLVHSSSMYCRHSPNRYMLQTMRSLFSHSLKVGVAP
ncbi:hypothetical protein BJ165DRAFT_616692 [Panaeolus papilionaceus]|nr:hypothetical protein BJ165DRAFT_616692 [Panaeolus papilionaceus]